MVRTFALWPMPSNVGAIISVCIKRGGDVPRGESYCGRHRPRRRSAQLRGGGAGIRRFREAVLAAAGYRCELVVDGVRCTARDNLEAHPSCR